jgi:hypothetical protein
MSMTMTKKTLFRWLSVGLLAVCPAFAANVGLELALLVDVSGSVDNTEFNLQRQGYVNAFNSAVVQNAILASQGGSIAATLVYWSGAGEQQTAVGWTLIDSVASAQAFATAIGNAARPYSGLTAPGSAINYITPLFNNNGFDSSRQVIDVSGDGAENDGANTATARNNALAAGVDAINGLAIGNATLQAWYAANIQGGAGSFTIQANDFADFGAAIEDKLVKEISGVPEPGTYAMLGTGLAGLALIRLRKRA